ncbi:MAG: bifunctional aspartate transaminase/aspartate 4-decarboxylase [Desulfovibrionaceae bacterium]|nr:bifunctional aspartate transaminase/aspartate 4-decarboxylase [Desulfovibrionaceae bacterium]
MTNMETQDLSELSPFELKNFLTDTAAKSGRLLLNAGRGNPNFMATEPRHAFFQWGRFAMQEAERSFSYMPEGVGGFPELNGIEERFEIFLSHNQGTPGIKMLGDSVSYVRDHLGLSAPAFIYEMTEGILGCMYPVPDRMLKLSEQIVGEYLRQEMVGEYPFQGSFKLFAVEGGTAAITYIFNTLRENGIISPNDSIALGMPTFTPYIEIPALADYRLNEVYINAAPELGWQYSPHELDKLLDPKVKAFFLVNPSNPPSVKLSSQSLRYLADIVRQRPDLIIITDDVYGTFADRFTSLFAICPRNTILVYSYSKYFGATGWRLGVIGVHEDNILDRALESLPEERKQQLDKRYESIATNPRELQFIDRLVADSRAVALNHTAGLATPAQVQMVLFSLFSLMDEEKRYRKAMQQVIRRRMQALYKNSPVKPEFDAESVDYYHLLDMEVLGEKIYEPAFIEWLLKRLKPNEFLFTLAAKAGVVLLPGKGFGTSHPSARVSLANLKEVQYTQIGQALKELMDSYKEEYLKNAGKPADKLTISERQS